MNSERIELLLQRIQQAENELADEMERVLEQKRAQFHYSVRKGKVRFEKGMRTLQRSYRKGVIRYILDAPLLYILTAPVIYGMIVPLVLVDASISLYQAICFRVYGIPRVRRRDYVVIDRHHLAYLNTIEKLNCIYCGYGNGVVAYAREIVARTEQYWCPIKHARRAKGTHHRADRFFEYGDAETYRTSLKRIRAQWDDASE